jgi:hypothetical protein
MNRTSLTTYVVVLACFTALVKADCLSNQTLTNLGFTNLTAATNYTNAAICNATFNQFGGCVTTDSLKSYLTSLHSTLKSRIDDGSSFTAIFDSIKGSVVNVFNKSNSTNATNEASQALENIKTTATNSRDSCLKALSYVHDGAYCLLASKGATNFATESLGFISIKASLVDVGASLQSCLPLIDAICTTVHGNPISRTDVYNSTLSGFNITFSNATCNSFKAFANCNTDTCTQNVRQLLIEQIFTTKDINFVLPKSTLDKINEFYTKAIDAIKKLFSRRLQTTKTEVRLTANVNGRALVADGKVSGVEAPTSSVKIAFAGLVTLLAILFA